MKASLLTQISDLTGNKIDEASQFILPSLSGEISDELLRPELQLFDLRKEQLAAGLKAIDSKRMPKCLALQRWDMAILRVTTSLRMHLNHIIFSALGSNGTYTTGTRLRMKKW